MTQETSNGSQPGLAEKKPVSRRDAMKRIAVVAAAASVPLAGGLSCINPLAQYCSEYYSYYAYYSYYDYTSYYGSYYYYYTYNQYYNYYSYVAYYSYVEYYYYYGYYSGYYYSSDYCSNG